MTIAECRKLLKAYGFQLKRPDNEDIYYVSSSGTEHFSLTKAEATSTPERVLEILYRELKPEYIPPLG
jgi:hypothetical protein